MEICLNIPDELFLRLQTHRNRLIQILSLGLRELEAKPSGSFTGLTDVLEFLASLPTEEEILRLRPSPQLQAQLEGLLEKQRTDGLSADEELEWQQYQYVEHLVRKAKLNAVKRRQGHRE
ncbi:MAG: hypothetical protein D3908_02300 [Candidatus Electrothrix sp. AUS4]|nr:hypothetical protein [Candidatus Electrothrix sp. AUS4]